MAAKQPDWEAIHSLYRAGLLSIRAIADRFDVSDTAIRSKAKKNGWSRDLTTQVRQAAKDKLVRTEVRTISSQQEVRTDEEIIEDAASEAASVVLAHRVDLAQWRGIANKLSAFLSVTAVTEDNHGDFARSLNAGVDAQLKVIKGERQAYNLDAEGGPSDADEFTKLLDDLEKEG